MLRERVTTRSLAAILAGVVVAGFVLGSGSAAGELSVDPTRSGPSESQSTHALTATVQSGDAVAGAQWNDVLVDYSLAQPTADVSNVGTGTIERIGIDRGNDDPGTQIDVEVTEIQEVTGQKDGKAVQITLGGNYTLNAGDEVVVVISPVQNPQNAGTSTVELTLNTQGGATSTTGSVSYEQHDASVTFGDQSSSGSTVTVDEVTLTEGGFVVVQNVSGASASEIRGSSAYLSPGTHQDVAVQLDDQLTGDATLVAQTYTDSNADRIFDYESSGGEKDGLYRNTDDNIVGTASASVTYQESTATPTPTPSQTATPTPMPTPSATPTTTTVTPTTTTVTPTTTTVTPTTTTVTPTPSPTTVTPTAAPTTPTTSSPTATPPSGSPTAVTPTPGDEASPTPAMSTPTPGDDAATPTPDDDTSTPAGTTTDNGESGPGFGAVVTVLALLGSAAVAVRRS